MIAGGSSPSPIPPGARIMNELNPYAAPLTDLATPRAPNEVGVWRDGTMLVMSKDAELPDRCLKCNAPAGGWKLKRKLTWHPQGYYLLVLFNLIIYAIVAMIVRKTAKVRRRQIALAWVLCLLGPVVLIAGGASETELKSAVGQDAANIVIVSLIVGGLLILLTGLIFAVLASKVATPLKIDKRFVWLKKVSPELLAGLPSWST